MDTATLDPPTLERPTRRRPLVTLVVVAFTFVAINGLLGQIGSFSAIGDALARADWWWVLLAAACSALTFPMAATALRAGLGVPVSLGTATALQAASKFVNLFTPAGLGSTALTVRFLRRKGVDTTSAVTSDVALSVVGGVAEVALAVACAVVARRHLHVGGLPEGTGRVVLLVVLLVGVAVAVLGRIPRFRAAVLPHLRRIASTVRRLVRTPRVTLTVAAAAVLTSALYAACLAMCLRAYGTDVPLATLVVVNWAATTVGSVSPVPGGLGVAEAGLVAGLTAAGVPSDVAVAAALTHRLVTFWLPPLAGWLALRHLRSRHAV